MGAPDDSRTIEATIRFVVPENGLTLAELESAVWASVQATARAAIASACEIIEADARARATGTVSLDRRRPLDVLTRFGWVRLRRWYQRDREREGYYYPLDAVLGLEPRQHASPWVIQQAAALAAQLSYRETAEFLTSYLDTNVDHRTLHSLVAQSRVSPPKGGGAPRASRARSSRVRQTPDKQPAGPASKSNSAGSS